MKQIRVYYFYNYRNVVFFLNKFEGNILFVTTYTNQKFLFLVDLDQSLEIFSPFLFEDCRPSIHRRIDLQIDLKDINKKIYKSRKNNLMILYNNSETRDLISCHYNFSIENYVEYIYDRIRSLLDE